MIFNVGDLFGGFKIFCVFRVDVMLEKGLFVLYIVIVHIAVTAWKAVDTLNFGKVDHMGSLWFISSANVLFSKYSSYFAGNTFYK